MPVPFAIAVTKSRKPFARAEPAFPRRADGPTAVRPPGPSDHEPAEAACPCGGGCPRCRAKAAGAPIPPVVGEALREPAESLDAGTRRQVEERFGGDLHGVRIHTGPRAGEAARAVQARAFTFGNDVAFAAGAYAPSTPRGRELLLHELAHVAQQRRAGGTPAEPHRFSEPGDPAERQAAAVAADAGGGAAPWLAPAPGVIQRQHEDDASGGHGGGRQVTVTLNLTGDCREPEKIAEAIPGARSMLNAAENFFISYAFLEPGQQHLVDAILQAHMGSSSDEVRHAVHRRLITMSWRLDQAMNGQLPFECVPASTPECRDHPWSMYVKTRERNRIYVCPAYFSETLERRRFMLMHESAHLAGVGDPVYLIRYGPISTSDCLTSDGLKTDVALDNADSYAWVVWCLTRQSGTVMMPATGGQISGKSK